MSSADEYYSVARPDFKSVQGYLHPIEDQYLMTHFAKVDVFDLDKIESNLLGYHRIGSNYIGLQQQHGDVDGYQLLRILDHEARHMLRPDEQEHDVRRQTGT